MAMLVALVPSASLYARRGSLTPRSHVSLRQAQARGEQSVQCFLRVTDEAALAQLQRLGVKVQHVFGKVITAQVPVQEIGRVSELALVRQVQLAQRMAVCNDRARQFSMVDGAHAVSAGSQGAFTGKDVIVGVVDVGIDFNHIEFMGEDGESRVKRVYLPAYNGGVAPVVDGNELPGSAYATPQEIAALTSDCTDQSHGTHTSTTAAGGYKGNGYYGVATASDLVLCAMPDRELTDVSIANSVAYIFDYAKSVGKPAVINMSLASTSGPHDGTSMLSEVFAAKSGKGRMCVLSVGNDARLFTKISKRFGQDTDTLRTFYENLYTLYTNHGDLDMWADDARKFKARFVVYDRQRQAVAYESDWYVAGTSDEAVKITMEDVPSLKDLYSGEVSFSSGIGANGKMELYTAFDVEYVCEKATAKNYYMGIKVWAEKGTTITGWSNTGTQLVSNGVDGWSYGTSDGNISDLTTGEGVISVGAYCSKTSVDTPNGVDNYNGSELGDIAFFSSFGKDVNGISRPTVTAPGYAVVSALNRYDATQSNDGDNALVQTIGGKKYRWGTMYGTSQSAPIVTGTIALWLQANPELTCADVENVLERTSTRDEYVMNGNLDKWGYGKINALKGLQYLLGSGIDSVEQEKLWRIIPGEEAIIIHAPCDGEAQMSAYDMLGQQVALSRCTVSGGYGDLPRMHLPEHGVYVVRVAVGGMSHTFKVIL